MAKKSQKNKKGPTREQLTDEQWSDVCRLFDAVWRISARMRAQRGDGPELSPS